MIRQLARCGWTCMLAILGLSVLASSPVLAACPNDSVESGPVCVDKYEASAWKTDNPSLIRKIKRGTVSLRELIAGGAIQLGASTGTGTDPAVCDYGTACDQTGNGCTNVFAVSIPGVIPAQCVNWFMAAAICRNAGKRLLTNQEWQVAAFGTPDPGTDNGTTDCNINGPSVALTGARTACVSDMGASDMVGNVVEFVAEWGELAEFGTTWGAVFLAFPNDSSNAGGDGFIPSAPAVSGLPGATLRGGGFAPSSAGSGALAGVFAYDQNGAPTSLGSGFGAGFRCGR